MPGSSELIRVLHVDDEPDFAEAAATFVEREDERLAVETEQTASAGLDRLAAEAFDCVVSDYDMPRKTGIEFLETVRGEYDDLPFVLYTGKGSEEIASEAISAGVTDYLQKKSGTDQYAILANRIVNGVERYRAQRERRRHLHAIETAREGISILDEEGYFVYVNEAYADLYGYEPEEMVDEHWELVYREDDVERVYEEILPELEESEQWRGETTGLRADGTTFVEDHTLSRTDRGELVCTVRDVTDRKERQRHFEAILNDTHTFVGLLEPDGTVLEANAAVLSFGGLDRSDVVGKPLWETDWVQSNDEAQATVREAVEQARNGDLFRDEIRIRRSEREAVIDFSVRPVTDDRGEVTLLVPEGHVVTERDGEPD